MVLLNWIIHNVLSTNNNQNNLSYLLFNTTLSSEPFDSLSIFVSARVLCAGWIALMTSLEILNCWEGFFGELRTTMPKTHWISAMPGLHFMNVI